MMSTVDSTSSQASITTSDSNTMNPNDQQQTNNIITNNNVTTVTLGPQHNITSQNVGQTTAPSNSTSNPQFIPLTRARMRENLDNQDIVDINTIEDNKTLDDVAKRARFFKHKLREEEFVAFHDLLDQYPYSELYIFIRDRILECWFANVSFELTKEKAYEYLLANLPGSVFESFEEEIRDKIFHRTFSFLDRIGRINFGIFDNKSSQPPELHHNVSDRSKRAPHMTSHLYKPPLKGGRGTSRVIIIGAGLSGLMAAKQLQRFGMEVIVIEARNRVGGRVHTYRKNNFIADLGPSTLNGVVGNPLVVLGRQLELCVMELKQNIPVYESKVDKNGQSPCYLLDSLLERAVEREYNKIMEGTRVLKNNYGIEKYHGNLYSVGTAVNWVMTLQEKNIKDDQINHLKSIEELYKKLIDSANKKLEVTRIIKELHGQLCSIKDSSTTDIGNHKHKSPLDTFQSRSLARDLNIALKEYKLLLQQEDEINNKISNLTSCPPSDTYLSLSDRRILDWHFAELEYALGCPINKLGIYYEDDEEIFGGSHWMLVHGFNTIVEAMKSDLDIQLGTAVKKITVGKNGCKVLTYHPDQTYSPYTEYTADAVLCTLPLGVLQDIIVTSQQQTTSSQDIIQKLEGAKTTQKGYQSPIFSPPLPKWKIESIMKLGCGNLNKIVLSFDKVFWDHELHLFGVVNYKAVARGEFFLFWHHGRTPTLTGLLSGEASDFIEKLSDVEVLERCLGVLRSIYGNNNVPAPKDYVVTKWRKDPWAKGAWSYLQTGSDGSDYEVCAEPVVLDADEQSFKETKLSENRTDGQDKPQLLKKIKNTDEIPRLFFAGEHTSRSHFASAHGAVITGLREAARIANIYLGCPYDSDKDPGIVIS